MAIVIPSKHIYSKSFDPVIDNNISNVEIEVKKPQLAIKEDAIAKQTIESDFNEGEIQPSIGDKSHLIAGSDGYRANYDAFAYISLTPIYAQTQIQINKQQTNKIVLSILSDEISKIQIAWGGTIIEGVANGYLQYNRNSSQAHYITVIDVPQITTTPTSFTESGYDLANETHFEHTYTYEVNDPKAGELSVKAKAENDLSDVSNIKIVEFSEYYELNLIVLAGLKIVKVGGGTKAPAATGNNFTSLLSGEYIEYVPSAVTITINGKVYYLDLQNKNLKIGDGNKVFSFDGNELIQTTNTPPPESRYQQIIDKWKNGKQTAVISCPVADYYDTDGNKVIDTTISGKMLFNIGDVVIPYVYTNKGDKPLSYNKDFTPKQFKVVGTKISKRQGITQELTLQEV
ncbi:MAG: hypothetical protein NC131_01095 [Roseburia sp.]|nr:hypothetical protein [Roseburia sp.]